MLQDVDMDDPGQTKRGARFEAKMDVGVSERRSSHQTGFDLTRPSDPLSSMATAPSTTVEGDSGNAFATPQRPIHPQVTDSPSPSISRQGSMGQTPSNLSRRISGKMSLGTLGFPSPHPIAGSGSVAYDPASSFTQHRSPASFPDTPSGNLSSSPSKHPTSPLSGSISPSSSFPKLPAQSPFANVPANSPWAHLAATSGEPTCSIDGPGGAIHSPFGPPVPALGGGGNQFMFPGSQNGQGRSISPHLGAPFELLNLGGGTPGPSRAPPGWPGVPSGTAQTPGIASHGMADPFSTLPTSTHSSSTTPSAVKFAGTNSNGSSGEMTPRLPTGVGSGFGIDSLAAKLAKRRGSKSGPSNLSKSTTATPTTETEEDRAIATAAASKKPFGPVSGPGRPAAGAGMPFKLNLPGGLAGRGAKGADGATSTSSTPGLSLSKPSGAQGAAGRPVTIPQALLPAQLPPLLKKDNGEVLILDLRPPSSFFESHLPNALSLPVPSTLLKRPAFTVEKLAEMLPANARKAVTSFTDTKEIVIIDQDSPIAAPGSVIVGLASKFGTQLAENVPDQKQSGWNGRIFFVKGGMSACSEVDGLSMEAGQDVGEEDDTSGNASSTQTDQKNGKMIGRLDRLAFSSASAAGAGSCPTPTKSLTLAPTSSAQNGAGNRTGQAPMQTLKNETDGPMATGLQRAATTSPNLEARPAIGRAQMSQGQRLQPANPFFDNIRQNLELAHGGIIERIPLELPEQIKARAGELPEFLKELLERPSPQVAEQLAKEFEVVERDEQKRLQGIMEYHSRGTQVASSQPEMVPGRLKRLASTGYMRDEEDQPGKGQESQEDYFPYSITAGVERGSKNRYKNIWPYDFSRVRLKEKCYDDGSDYINANFIQPQGTVKRYIATQGPLDATFRDFWTLVWEQQVHVIVMLTKQFEGGACKCGAYWTDGKYGPFQLEHISTEGGEDTAEKDVSGFNFHVGGSTSASANTPNIKRTFLLSHTAQPDVKPRKVVQLQCVAWPDFDVPDDPRLLLGLVKEVDKATVQSSEEEDANARKAPVLVHCSAGVGRTGSFMVVDSILDGLRREHQRQHRKIRGSHSSMRTKRGQHSIDGILDRRRGSSVSSAGNDSPVTSLHSVPSVQRLTSPLRETNAPGIASPESMEIETPKFADPFAAEMASKRRGSVVSTHSLKSPGSPEREFNNELGFIPLIKGENLHDRELNLISELDNPVQDVLGSMRLQRMSLVQSLRQYAFVYRAIIYGFLDILDEEKEAENEVAAMYAGKTFGSSGINTDEDHHSKRRASPTSLSGPSLHKRPSIKINRSPKINGGSDESASSLKASGLSTSISASDNNASKMETD